MTGVSAMNTSITNEDKKFFLKWFTHNFELKRRESLWIIDYLYNNDIMLDKTHFVEQVEKTPRGIYMTVKGNQQPSFRFYKNGHIFKDAMQAFHEIRLNWSSKLYIEVAFDNAWQYPEYLNVLEDNPFAKWNETIPEETVEQVNDALEYETLLLARKGLLKEINETLTTGSENKFKALTQKLKEINIEIDKITYHNES